MVARFVIGAPASSQGKTTVTIGLMAALNQAGYQVAPFKVGPDYIDPGYHSLAAGRVGRNLDAHLCGADMVAALFTHGSQDADIAVIEGVMGLFDGKIASDGFGSTAHIAELVEAPVIVVLDGSGSSATPAAIALGLASYSKKINICAAIVNKVSSPRAAAEIRRAFSKIDIPLVGIIPRSADLVTPSRHLGLIPAAERQVASQMVALAGEVVAANCDIDQIVAVANSASDLSLEPWAPKLQAVSGCPNIAIAGGNAFTFHYAETAELLVQAGCQVSEFDPIHDTQLPPDIAGLYLGGGFPEIYAKDLASNQALLKQIRDAVADGLPVVAECAGLLYLAKSIDGIKMAGALDLNARMTPRLKMGYKSFEPTTDSVIYRVGEAVNYHEFHRTITDKDPIVSTENIQASYQHVHWAAYPQFAQRFAQAAADTRISLNFYPTINNHVVGDLACHGDSQLIDDGLDFAVNLHSRFPDPGLRQALAEDLINWASYPNFEDARQAIAKRHRVDPEMVLPTAGAAEAFDLIARGLNFKYPLVIHPQFTEPERALQAAGYQVYRQILPPPDFELSDVDDIYDLVVIGNPTNPTSVLHDGAKIRALTRAGRLVIVDEAFMDSVPGESQSVVGEPGILVVRSLTKSWSIAGVRAGYLIGDPTVVKQLAELRQPWAVSTPAATVMKYTAHRLGDRYLQSLADNRGYLVDQLKQLGISVVKNPAGPFVLADISQIANDVPKLLRETKISVRDCASFPGLGTGWIRIAVRDLASTDRLIEALAQIGDQ